MVDVKTLIDTIKKLEEQVKTNQFEYTHMIAKEIVKRYHLNEEKLFTIIINGRITLKHSDNEMFKLSFDSKELLLKHLISLITIQSSQKTINFYEIEPAKEK